MKKTIVLLACLLALGINAQELKGSKWLLTGIDDLETGIRKDIGSSAKATLNFDSDSTYSGKFCNNYHGRFKNNKSQVIRFSTPVHTKMLCMGIDKYEKELFSLFPLATKYRFDGELLFVFTSNMKRMTFKKG